LDEGINFRVCKLDSKVATDAQNLSFVEFNYLKSSLNQKDPGCDVLTKCGEKKTAWGENEHVLGKEVNKLRGETRTEHFIFRPMLY
ncbi:hypothetical protein Avbf_18374, partial [Armadillidium vulgare]